MSDAITIWTALHQDALYLKDESQLAEQRLLLAMMEEQPRHFPATLYGLMLVCFATIDLASRLWRGFSDRQTQRMVEFITSYLGATSEAAFIAVQMWRHTLMHTSQPRILRCQTTGVEYAWLLHWGNWLPREDHFQVFRITAQRRKLDLALSYLLDDLCSSLQGLLEDLPRHETFRANVLAANPEVLQPEFKLPQWIERREFD